MSRKDTSATTRVSISVITIGEHRALRPEGQVVKAGRGIKKPPDLCEKCLGTHMSEPVGAMCKFITVTVNEEVDLTAFHGATNDVFVSLNNPSVTSQLPKGRLYFVHRGHCDCRSAIGRACNWLREPYTEEEVRALLAKGGSPAKLEHWKRRRIEAYGKERNERKRSSPKDLIEMGEWLDRAKEVLELPSARRFGFLHHFYRGRIDSEDFKIAIAPKRSIQGVSGNVLLELTEDTLQEFTR